MGKNVVHLRQGVGGVSVSVTSNVLLVSGKVRHASRQETTR